MQSRAAHWRWKAAKLRARAALVDDDVAREQLIVFAADCEEEAQATERSERLCWRRA